MKSAQFLPACLAVGIILVHPIADVGAAEIKKANNNTILTTAASWSPASVPGANDTAVWDNTVSTAANCTNGVLVAASATWGGIRISNPAVAITITNGGTLRTTTNGAGGIDMSGATVDFTFFPQL